MMAVPDMTVSDGIMHQVWSHSDGFGAIRNPYNPDRIPGGSSGGSAGAIVRGPVCLARRSADRLPDNPNVASPIRAGGPQEPLGETLTINSVTIEEGKVTARNIFMAPRFGIAALTIPAGMSNGLPVGLQFDALPGHDSELLGLGMAAEAVLGRIPAPPPGPPR
jgi:Asp-tRNA(Asn)/Glu-tRNA(Gln) amidotransferase A subunit family amidase